MNSIKVKEQAIVEYFMRTYNGKVQINDDFFHYRFTESNDYAQVFICENNQWIELIDEELEVDSPYKLIYDLIIKVGPKDFGLVDEIWEFNPADY
jgi:hypothetical protein